MNARCAHQVTSSSRTTLSSASSPAGGAARPAVVVDGHAELFAHLPERARSTSSHRAAEVPSPEAHPAAGRHRSVRRPWPSGSPRRSLDVVQHDLADAGSPSGGLGTEIRHPPVVRLQAGPSGLEIAGVGARGLVGEARPSGRTAGSCSGRSPRRRCRRVRAPRAAVRVPIPVGVRTLQILVRDLVGLGPCVEVVVPARGEVRPVAAQLRTPVAVGRDGQVPLVRAFRE